LKELTFGDQRARRVGTRPVVREVLGEFYFGDVVGGESGYEVGDGGRLVLGIVKGVS